MLFVVADDDRTIPFYEDVFDELRDSGYVLPESIFDRCTLTIGNIVRVVFMRFWWT